MAVIALSTFFFYQSCTPDPCKDVVCNHGGTCATGTCTCPTGYEGTDCGTLSRAKFLKVWSVSTNSCVSPAGWQTTISAGTGDLDLVLGNFSDLLCGGQGLSVNAVMTGSTTFNIPSQTLCSGAITISGSGTINGNQVNTTYTTSAGTCTEVYN